MHLEIETYGVDVVSEESGLDTSEHGVNNDTKREEETSRSRWHTSQGVHDGRTTSQ